MKKQDQKSKYVSYRNKILIVDDEPTSRKLFESMLPSDKYELIIARNGNEALEIAYEELPDLVLLDIMMPEMDGFEVTRKLKKNSRVKNTPIILVTALEGPENRIAGLEAGAEEFLNKPVKPIELLARVKSMLRLKQYRDQLAIRNQSIRTFADISTHHELTQDPDIELPLVLLVEDNEIDARILQSTLKNENFRLEVAKNGKDALSRVQSGTVDLILLDILLPDMSGFDICHRLRKMDKGKDIPIIIITCLKDLDSKIKGVELGSDDFLVKPIIGPELKARIKVLLEKKEQLDKLRSHYKTALNSAIIDWLTGLYNHGYFKKYLELEIKRSLRHIYPVSLIMMDVDDFKDYNDTLGHSAGDDILKDLAQVVRDSIRDIDLAARYGGDEFVVVLPYANCENAMGVAQRIQKAIGSHNFFQKASAKLNKMSVSIGVTTFPSDVSSAEEMIQKTDQMLYKAKQAGKDQICIFSQEFSAQECL